MLDKDIIVNNNANLVRLLMQNTKEGNQKEIVNLLDEVFLEENQHLIKTVFSVFENQGHIKYLFENILYDYSCTSSNNNIEGQFFFIPITLEEKNNQPVKSKELLSLITKDLPDSWRLSIFDQWFDMKKLENISFFEFNEIKKQFLNNSQQIIESEKLNQLVKPYLIKDINNFDAIGSEVIVRLKNGTTYNTKISERGILGFLKYPELKLSDNKNNATKNPILFDIMMANPALALTENENIFLDHLSLIYNNSVTGFPKTIQETISDYKSYKSMADLESRLKQQFFNLGEKPLIYFYQNDNKFRISITDQKAYLMDEIEIKIELIDFDKLKEITEKLVFGVIQCDHEDDLPKFNRKTMN